MATQSYSEENMKALSNQVDTLIAEIGGRKFKGDEAANLKNLLNEIRSKLEGLEIKTGGKDYLLLKWGTLKGWEFHSDKGKELLKKYFDLPQSGSGAMTQHDTPEQKELIIQLIDECDGTIQNDWDGNHYTKQQAKEYVLGYDS